MRFRLLIITFIGLTAVFAQSRFQLPVVGVFLDADRSVRPVRGVAGTFVIGESYADESVAAAASRELCLVKTDSEILVFDSSGNLRSRHAAPAGGALFAFADSGVPLAAFLRESGELWTWWREEWKPVPLGSRLPADQVISMASIRNNVVGFEIRGYDGYWIQHVSPWNGRVLHEAALPGVTEPLVLLEGGRLLFGTEERLVLRSPEGLESDIVLDGAAVSLHRLSPRWFRVGLHEGQGHLAISITDQTLTAFRLPEVRQ